jgi:hypothetical protein
MGFDIKVAATGIVALCLVLSAMMFLSSISAPALAEMGRMFFGFAILLVIVVILLALFKVKVRFP